MRDPENIVAIAALKPDYMGFIFYPDSPRCIGPETLAFLKNESLPDLQKTGVFVNAPVDDVIDDFHTYHLDFVQLHGEESPQYCHMLKQSGLRIIKAFGIGTDFDFSVVENYHEVDFFLFDTASAKYGGSGEPFHWEHLHYYTNDKPYFLSGGITPYHVQEIKSLDVRQRPFAVDINSRFESSPGYKDVASIHQFIQNLST